MKLNLGCGTDYKEGYINVDSSRHLKEAKIDYYLDLNGLPYPWEDNSADEIYVEHVLEHLNAEHTHVVEWFSEIHRILKPNGKLVLIYPYYNCDIGHGFGHTFVWQPKFIDFFTTRGNPRRRYVSKNKLFTLESEKYVGIFPFEWMNKRFGRYLGNIIKEIKWVLVK